MMTKKSLSTGDLFLIAQKTKNLTLELKRQFSQGEEPTFCSYLKELMEERKLTAQDLEIKALLSRSFSFQICAGSRIPNRNIVLRLALVMGLDIDQTQRLLKLAGRGVLYPKVKRDMALINALSNGMTVYQANERLTELGLEPLL